MQTGRWLRVWALGWAGLLGFLFTVVTALTLVLWFADPTHAQTNPVLDLGFFALGAMLASGFVSQARRRSAAGVAQALIAAASLMAAGLVGERIEPAVGGLVLVVAAVVLGAVPPRRRWRIRSHRGRVPLAIAAGLAAAPGGVHAAAMLVAAGSAGPSCFLGRCAAGDRLAESAALMAAIVLVAVVAAIGLEGWRLCTWSSGAAAILIGLTSVVLPAQVGSLGSTVGAMAIGWGVVVVVTGDCSNRLKGKAPT